MIEGLRASERTSEQSCPLCREPVGRAPWVCAGCEVGYHTACALELGGCATLGCARRGHGPPRTEGERFELSPERRAELATAVADEELAARARRLAARDELRPPLEVPDLASQARVALAWLAAAALGLAGAIWGPRLATAAVELLIWALDSGSALELFLLLFLPLAAMAIVGMLAAEWHHHRPRR